LPSPSLEDSIENIGWSERAVNNVIDVLDRGWIKVFFLDTDKLRIEFCPIVDLPKQLGHVSELKKIAQNLTGREIFGSKQPGVLTFLQTVDFAVEGHIDDETEGKEYGRVYVASGELMKKRNIYLDPESLYITDYEYGYSFCVKGGIPIAAIEKIEVIKAKRLDQEGTWDFDDDYLEKEDVERSMKEQAVRLRKLLEARSVQ